MSEKQSYYVGVKGIITSPNNGVLILKDTSRGRWELPGGRIDKNENFRQAFSREISEEIPGAADVELGEIVHVAQGDFIVENEYKLLLIFYTARVLLPSVIQVSGEHSEFSWVNADTIEAFDLFSTDKEAIQRAYRTT